VIGRAGFQCVMAGPANGKGITVSTPINQVSEANRTRFAIQAIIEQKNAAPIPDEQADAEWSDSGRDLEHYPRGWWLRPAILLVILFVAGGGLVALNEFMALGSRFLR